MFGTINLMTNTKYRQVTKTKTEINHVTNFDRYNRPQQTTGTNKMINQKTEKTCPASGKSFSLLHQNIGILEETV